MLKEIIPAITPSNITDIQLLKDSLDIFLDYLSKHSDISLDIKNILSEDKIPIYEEFVKIYLDNIYKILTQSEHNDALYDKLRTMYRAVGKDIENIDLSIDPVDLLKKDYILTNKSYKESKGTPKAMEYIYNIIIRSGIQEDILNDNLGNFRYIETGNIFEYKIEGTMIDEMYEHFVKPLTHPVGWAYFYQRVFYESWSDYFDLEFIYTFTDLKVKCMNGFIFTNDNYLTNISHDDNKLVQDIVEDGVARPGNKVVFVDIEYFGEGSNRSKKTTVYFENGQYIISVDDPRSLIFYNADNTVNIDYDNEHGNCGLHIIYSIKKVSTVKDNIEFTDISHIASTTGKMNVIGAGNVYLGSFIVGDELVNKNVPVTYKSYTGKQDGADVANIFAAGGITELDFGKFGTFWDEKHLYFDQFNFDDTSLEGSRYPPNLSGKTARDEYEINQILQKCPSSDGYDHLCNNEFTDKFAGVKKWDQFGLKFNNFNYDSEYVSEEFKINYDINVWDTDLYFNYFKFDGPYIGGGFSHPV